MGQIINIKNLNTYCGRYSKKAKTPEKEIGWYVYDSFIEKFPVLSLRNRNPDDNWPLSWERNRNLPLAIDLTLKSLKAWQAFRPERSNKVIHTLKKNLPRIILGFQKKMLNYKIKNARDITRMNKDDYIEVLTIMSKTVGDASSHKNDKNPMLGSKILHFFFPELFPLWDTAWIKNTALIKEDLSPKALGDWLPHKVRNRLKKYNKAALTYASYVALMLKDLDDTSHLEYKNIKKGCIKHS